MHCPFLLLVTFIFIDTLTNRANNEGRRLEVSGAEIERLKKGKSLTTIHKHNWQIEVCSVTSIKIEQPYIANVSAGLSQTHWHSVIQIITQLAKQFKLTVTTQQQAQRRSSSPPYPLPPSAASSSFLIRQSTSANDWIRPLQCSNQPYVNPEGFWYARCFVIQHCHKANIYKARCWEAFPNDNIRNSTPSNETDDYICH